MKRIIRDLIVGEDVYIASRTEFRQVMLSGQYAILALLVIAFYMGLEMPDGFTATNKILLAGFVSIFFSLVLHRQQLHCVANYFLFPTLYLLLYLMVSSENKNTGAFLFFIPVSLGSFAVFNYQQRKVAIAFAILGSVLFATSMMSDFSLIQFRTYSEHTIQVAQFRNFCVAFLASIAIVYLLISLNHHTSIQLVQTNKQLSKLNEELDRFVYSTSHDLRAPLLSIRGLLKLAEGDVDKKELEHYHRLMQTRLTSLENFVKEITDYSRNNRVEIVKENVDISLLTDEIWESLRYSAEARGITFFNELPHDFVVMNDGARMRVVLSNLIANAIRYHDHRKELKYIKVYHHITPSSFSIHVEDNGQGIAPEIHSKIFDMFYRGNDSSGGSGLGLYIVKETLAKLSGTIKLCSSLREGSTFSISLPK